MGDNRRDNRRGRWKSASPLPSPPKEKLHSYYVSSKPILLLRLSRYSSPSPPPPTSLLLSSPAPPTPPKHTQTENYETALQRLFAAKKKKRSTRVAIDFPGPFSIYYSKHKIRGSGVDGSKMVKCVCVCVLIVMWCFARACESP